MDTEYRVCLPKLLECAAGLEQTARRQKQALADLQDTENRLKRLSYMDEVLRQLWRREQMMEEQLQKTLRMAQALRRIHQTLAETENAVIDGIELPPPLPYGYQGHHGHRGRYRTHPHGWGRHPHRPPVRYFPPRPDCPPPPIDEIGDDHFFVTSETITLYCVGASREEPIVVWTPSVEGSENLFQIKLAEDVRTAGLAAPQGE